MQEDEVGSVRQASMASKVLEVAATLPGSELAPLKAEVQDEEVGSSRQAVTVSRVDEREEHVAVEQELEDEELPPPSDMGRLDAVLRMQRVVSK